MSEAELQILSGEVRNLTKSEKSLYPNYKYVVGGVSKYTYGDQEVEVPKGFLTDGSSGAPDYGRSWLFHDYLYATHKFTSGQACTRQEADDVMERVLRHEKLGWYCWLFVRASNLNPFWIFSRAWKNSGRRGLEILDSAE